MCNKHYFLTVFTMGEFVAKLSSHQQRHFPRRTPAKAVVRLISPVERSLKRKTKLHEENTVSWWDNQMLRQEKRKAKVEKVKANGAMPAKPKRPVSPSLVGVPRSVVMRWWKRKLQSKRFAVYLEKHFGQAEAKAILAELKPTGRRMFRNINVRVHHRRPPSRGSGVHWQQHLAQLADILEAFPLATPDANVLTLPVPTTSVSASAMGQSEEQRRMLKRGTMFSGLPYASRSQGGFGNRKEESAKAPSKPEKRHRHFRQLHQRSRRAG